MSKNDGGPAFPRPSGEYHDSYGRFAHSPSAKGMTLRDWFAGQALTGHLASLNPGSWGNDKALAKDAAQGAYLVADAMLAEREKDRD